MKALVLADGIRWVDGDTTYDADRGDEVDLPQDEFARLRALGAVGTVDVARSDAEAQIEVAVERALTGDLTAFDQLRGEAESLARQRFQERLAAGEGAEGLEFVHGPTGGPL